MRFLNILLLVFVVSCNPKKKENVKKIAYGQTNSVKGNELILGDIRISDSISGKLFSNVKIIPLNTLNHKSDDWTDIRFKVYNDNFYIHQTFGGDFYHFDDKGNLKTFISLKPYLKNQNIMYLRDFFVDRGKITFLAEKPNLLTFDGKHLIPSKNLNFWAANLEIQPKKGFIFYVGNVNDDFGHPNHITLTDSLMNIRTTFFPKQEGELKISMKVSFSAHHLFKSNENINMVKDQDNFIYQYPDFTKPHYKINFVGHKINPLEVSTEPNGSPVFYRYAKLNSFWESSNAVIAPYSYEQSSSFFIHDKNSKRILSRTTLSSIDHFLLVKVQAVYNDYFISVLEPELISSLKQLKKNQRGFLKDYVLPDDSSKTPLLVMFKLKDF